MKVRFIALALVLPCSSACYQASVPTRNARPDAAMPQPAHDAGENDAGTTDAGHDGGQDASPGPALPKHHSCNQPLPAQLPANPGSNGLATNPDGTAPNCEFPLEILECTGDLPCPDSLPCIKPELSAGRGYCDPGAVPGELVPLSYANGQCLSLVHTSARDSLCCSPTSGFDCRPFFPHVAVTPRSQPGLPCRTHDDCEAGLVCKVHSSALWGTGWGRCLCPEISPELVVDDAQCTVIKHLTEWGDSAPQYLKNGCDNAQSPGWVVERVANEVTYSRFAVAVDGKAQLHVAYDKNGLTHAVRVQGSWQAENITQDLGAESPAMTVDASGFVHIANGAPSGLGPSYASNVTGSWQVQHLPGSMGADQPRIAVDALGAHISYIPPGLEGAVHHVHPGPSGFLDDVLHPGYVASQALVQISTGLVWVLETNDGPLGTLLFVDHTGAVIDSAAEGSHVQAAATADDELYASYLLPLDNSLRLAHRADGKISSETVWRQLNPEFSQTRLSDHSVAVDPSGRPFIAHTAPEGIVFETRDDQGHWTKERLIGEALPPTLVIDANGKPHIFYWTDNELRHVFQGHCP